MTLAANIDIEIDESYISFIKAYPKGKYREEAFWKLACLKNDVSGYDDYLESYPNGKYKAEAIEKQVSVEEDAFWARCIKAHSISEFRKFSISWAMTW